MFLKRLTFISLTFFILLLFGCSNDTEQSQPDTTSPSPTVSGKAEEQARANEQKIESNASEPVTLNVCDYNTGVREELFNLLFKEPMAKKHPEITLQLSETLCNSPEVYHQLISSNAVPDIILLSNPAVASVEELDLIEDFSPIVKRANLDLQNMNEAVRNDVQRPDMMIGMPFAMNYGAMAYNKDLLDRFAIPHPSETPTWDEMLALNRTFTRTEDNTNFIGIYPGSFRDHYLQLELNPIDLEGKKVNLTSDDRYYQILSMLQQFTSVPGFIQGERFAYYQNDFFVEQISAAYANWLGSIYLYANNFKEDATFEWDLTAYPVFPDRPEIGKQVDYHLAMVTSTSKHKEAAFLAVANLISEDIQLALSKAGRLSVLELENIRSVFASDSGVFQGKNLQAVFKVKPAKAPVVSKYDAEVTAVLTGEMTTKVVLDGIDINTALREAEEKINNEIMIH